jgi:hypothetical protein
MTEAKASRKAKGAIMVLMRRADPISIGLFCNFRSSS